jgi:hypothetical protein
VLDGRAGFSRFAVLCPMGNFRIVVTRRTVCTLLHLVCKFKVPIQFESETKDGLSLEIYLFVIKKSTQLSLINSSNFLYFSFFVISLLRRHLHLIFWISKFFFCFSSSSSPSHSPCHLIVSAVISGKNGLKEMFLIN